MTTAIENPTAAPTTSGTGLVSNNGGGLIGGGKIGANSSGRMDSVVTASPSPSPKN